MQGWLAPQPDTLEAHTVVYVHFYHNDGILPSFSTILDTAWQPNVPTMPLEPMIDIVFLLPVLFQANSGILPTYGRHSI